MRAWVSAFVALAGVVAGAPGAAQAQGQAGQGWTSCRLDEPLPGGGLFRFHGAARTGSAPMPAAVSWASGRPGDGAPLHLTIEFGRRADGPPTGGLAFYRLGSPASGADYKLVFDFGGAGPAASLPLVASGASLSGRFLPQDGAAMAGFARAQRVTATVYQGERAIGHSAFELSPERRAAGLAAFARRIETGDPALCGAAAGPPLPVPPVEHR